MEVSENLYKLYEPRKNPALLSMKYWLVNRDPYNALL